MPDYRTALRVRRLTFVLLFFSGASSLTYEVAWVRELSLSFGVSVYAVTAVLTAFMGGLALGSWLWGRVVAYRAPLRLYAVLQFGVALAALLSPFVFAWIQTWYIQLYNQISPSFYTFNIIRFGLAALVLLVPATLMGGSFPVISQFLADREDQHGSDLGRLYAINTLGGVIGTFLTGLFLIRFLGVHTTIYLAAAIDVVIAVVALLLSRQMGEAWSGAAPATSEVQVVAAQPKASKTLSRRAQRYVAAQAAAEAATQPTEADRRRWRREASIVWACFGLSGFVSLAYEVAWTRLVAIFTLNTVFSFTIMLTTFLIGLAVGSLLIAERADRTREPYHLFGYLQLMIGLAAVLMLFVFARLYTILQAVVSVVSFPSAVAAEFVASGVTMLVPTLLIGATFPVAARIYARGAVAVGSRIGLLYGVNTVGAMLGSLVCGFVFIPLLGLQRTCLLLAMLNLAIGVLILLTSHGKPRWQAGGLVVAAAIAAVLLPPGIYLGFREGAIPELVFYREGIDATVSVFEVKSPPLKISFVNGRSEVPTDRDSMRAFYLLGNLPPLLRPDAQSVLMVSFGNGIASGTMARHKVPRIQAVEIVAEQVEAAQLYRAENRNVLDYPGLNITIEDGRNYLLRTQEQFDIITADATHPISTSSWALFTREFYTLVRQHLADDGVFVQWLPFHDLRQDDYRAIIKTYQSVFPHTSLWFTGGTHTFLVATPKPLTRANILALQSRMEQVGVTDDLVSAERLAEDFMMDEAAVADYVADARIVTDDSAFFVPEPNMDAILESFKPYMASSR